MASLYSFFATTLAAMLAGPPDGDATKSPRNITFDSLDSERLKGWSEQDDLRLHPEVIRRLKQSLTTEGMYTTLNKDDLAKVVKVARLTDDERLRLVAAVVATKMQAELAPRISTRRAYLAAAQIYPLIVEGMRELEANEQFDGTFKTGGDMSTLSEFDRVYHAALTAIDRGLLALNAVPYTEDVNEKHAVARQADDAFTLALAKFDAQPQTGDPWDYWHQEAAQGQAAARRYLPTR